MVEIKVYCMIRINESYDVCGLSLLCINCRKIFKGCIAETSIKNVQMKAKKRNKKETFQVKLKEWLVLEKK